MISDKVCAIILLYESLTYILCKTNLNGSLLFNYPLIQFPLLTASFRGLKTNL